jgi:hypothetical protein
VWLGLPGAAWAVVGYASVARIAYGMALHRLIDLSSGALFRSLRLPAMGCGAMVIAKLLLNGVRWEIAVLVAIASFALFILPMLLRFRAARDELCQETAIGPGAVSPS